MQRSAEDTLPGRRVVRARKTRYVWMVTVLAEAKRRFKESVFDAVPGGRLLWRGPRDVRRVAITFDDGPDEMTEDYLDVLDQLAIPATFFIMGDLAVQRPDLVQEYIRRGHQVASHGFNHRRFPTLSWKELDFELTKSAEAIGPQPVGRPWVRPPYGAIDTRVIGQILARGWVVALWSMDSHDYEETDPGRIIARCAPAAIRPGEVLLFHENQQTTLDALPRIVEGIKGAGYECVTMADLFAV